MQQKLHVVRWKGVKIPKWLLLSVTPILQNILEASPDSIGTSSMKTWCIKRVISRLAALRRFLKCRI
ncbi:hypothetical protein O9992_12025 [Vibrio lentus]|nr:hypothetical protein [Vibrio lentus]